MVTSRDAWMPPGLAQLFDRVLDLAARGEPLAGPAREEFVATGRAAYDSGGTLSALVEQYLQGAGELWEQVFAAPGSGVDAVVLGRTLRQISETAVAALAEGFERAQRRGIRAEEDVRRDVIDDLLAGVGSAAVRAERATAIGVRIDGEFVVGTVEADEQAPPGPAVSDDGAWLPGAVERELRRRRPDRSWHCTTASGRLVVLVGAARPGDPEPLADVLALGPGEPWRVGVGGRHRGLDGLARSHAEAAAAVRLGASFALTGFLHHHRLGVYRLLAGEPGAADALVGDVLPVLEAARSDLLETLGAFVRTGGNMAEMSRDLSIGARTVAYRLDRIGELTGWSVRDPDGRLTLELAYRCLPLVSRRTAPARSGSR